MFRCRKRPVDALVMKLATVLLCREDASGSTVILLGGSSEPSSVKAATVSRLVAILGPSSKTARAASSSLRYHRRRQSADVPTLEMPLSSYAANLFSKPRSQEGAADASGAVNQAHTCVLTLNRTNRRSPVFSLAVS